MSAKLGKIVWAVESNPLNQMLEANTFKHLVNFNAHQNAKIQPVSIMVQDPDKTLHQKRVEKLNERMQSYRDPNLETVHTLVKEDDLSTSEKVDSLLKYAQQHEADLIVVQTHAKEGVERLFLGSFTESLILESKIPTLTVNPSTPAKEATKKTLFLTDFSQKSKQCFEEVLELAKQGPSEVVVFHRVEQVHIPFGDIDSAGSDELAKTLTDELIEESKDQFKPLQQLAESMGVKVSYVAKSGKRNPADEIAQFVADDDFDLVAMVGTSNAFSAFLLGSLTRQMVRFSPVPVWTLHI